MTRPSSVDYSVIRSLDEAQSLREDWHRLLRANPEGTAFHSFEWNLTRWQHIHDRSDLFVVVVRSHGRSIAILPGRIRPHGNLVLIGEGVSNYGGVVYDADHLDEALLGLDAAIGHEPGIRSLSVAGLRGSFPLFRALKRRPIAALGPPSEVQTAVCPQLELADDWSRIIGQRAGKQRTNWKKKWRRLSSLGRVTFATVDSPGKVAEVLPRLFELFGARWARRFTRGGFSRTRQPFITAVSPLLCEQGLLDLAILSLEDRIIAFSYGVRSGPFTTSYVLGHDECFNTHSVGTLLLTRILQSACERGDPLYDFSLGETPYKAVWATRHETVHRLTWGSFARWRAAGTRTSVLLRSVDWIRALRMRRLTLGPEDYAHLPDRGDLRAGSRHRWFVYTHEGELRSEPAAAAVGELLVHEHGISQLLRFLLAERQYRGDQAVRIQEGDRWIGLAWRAAARRAPVVSHGAASENPALVVYYHPIPMPGATLEQVVTKLMDHGFHWLISPVAVRVRGLQRLHAFRADWLFRGSRDA